MWTLEPIEVLTEEEERRRRNSCDTIPSDDEIIAAWKAGFGVVCVPRAQRHRNVLVHLLAFDCVRMTHIEQ